MFSDAAEKDAATARDDAAYYKKMSDKLGERSKLQDDENAVLEQRLKMYMDATSNLSKEVATRDTTESYIRIGYFVLGVVVTGLAVRNIRP